MRRCGVCRRGYPLPQYRSARGLLAGVLFFQLLEMPLQFLEGRPTAEVMAEHLEGAFTRLAARGSCEEHAGDQGAVDLDGDAVEVVAEQMAAAEHALEPAEVEFRLPAIMPPK